MKAWTLINSVSIDFMDAQGLHPDLCSDGSRIKLGLAMGKASALTPALSYSAKRFVP